MNTTTRIEIVLTVAAEPKTPGFFERAEAALKARAPEQFAIFKGIDWYDEKRARNNCQCTWELAGRMLATGQTFDEALEAAVDEMEEGAASYRAERAAAEQQAKLDARSPLSKWLSNLFA